MPTSLFIEHHAQGCAFYINGALQFDTTDEALYHEYLVLPALALAVQRFPSAQLRVLICGGGDGLAAREALRFAEVGEITLVDYNPDVLELGRTTFRPYNQGSLVDDHTLGAGRVAVYTQEASDFVAALPDACFHAVICDFTCPTHAEETQIYSQEWFAQLRRILVKDGVIATNAVSPDHTATAFWCIYQTLFAAGLQPKPMQISIPSFQRHGYGNWGFFLASPQLIQKSELEMLSFPFCLRALPPESWRQAFVFSSLIANMRHSVCLHTLQHPQLLYYLLNPHIRANSDQAAHPDREQINFLELEETGTGQVAPENLLQLDGLAKLWLRQQSSSDQPLPIQSEQFQPEQFQPEQIQSELFQPEQLFPVQHHYHNPRMVREWSTYLQRLLEEVDQRQLLSHLLKRSQDLPPKVAADLKQWLEALSKNQPVAYVSTHAGELMTILAVTLLMANLATPEPVFAKGYYSGSRGGSSSGEFRFGWTGFWLMIIGGVWLWGLNRDQDR